MSGDETIDATVGLRPGRGALRQGVLRVRRRLRRPARRRPPGLRAGVEPADQGPRVGPAHGLPRAVDPLHRLRPAPPRPLPLLPRPRGARVEPRRPLRRRHGPHVRRLRRAGARAARSGSAAATPRSRATPTSSTASRSRPRPSTPVRGHAARRVAVQRRHLRHRPGLRGAAAAHAGPPAARGPALRRDDAHRAAQGDPVVPQAGRPGRPGRRLERVPRRRPRRRWPTRPTPCSATACRGRPMAPRDARRLRPRRRGQGAGRHALPAHRTCPRTSARRGSRAWRRGALRPAAGLRRASGPTAATSRAGPSSGRATASTSWPTTARSATCSATAC